MNTQVPNKQVSEMQETSSSDDNSQGVEPNAKMSSSEVYWLTVIITLPLLLWFTGGDWDISTFLSIGSAFLILFISKMCQAIGSLAQ